MGKMLGSQSVLFERPPRIIGEGCVVGPKEGEGPLAAYFDRIWKDEKDGAESWEKAESQLAQQSLRVAMSKAGVKKEQIRLLAAGDLLNQLTATHFGVRELGIPFVGAYGACPTMGLSMLLAAMAIDGGFADLAAAEASSHFCTSEKQFRTPLGYGSQRPLYATWTVTGSGAVVLSSDNVPTKPMNREVVVRGGTIGRIVDYGVKDAFNMGGAMAPAAADVLLAHFRDFDRQPSDYDCIYTGDLGYYGAELLTKMMEAEGYLMEGHYRDCGTLIYDSEEQDTHGGGSGCGCSAVTFTGYLMRKLRAGKLDRILFVPTGALLSPLSTQQGESIPCIAHALIIESQRPEIRAAERSGCEWTI